MSPWFVDLAKLASIFAVSINVEPIGSTWNEKMSKGHHYYYRGWIILFSLYTGSFFLRHAHLLRKKNGNRAFSVPVQSNMHRLAALLIIRAPTVVPPFSLTPGNFLCAAALMLSILKAAVKYGNARLMISVTPLVLCLNHEN